MKRTLLLAAIVFAITAVPVAAQDVTPDTQIARFEVMCAVRGARLEWDMSSHVGVTHFDLYHNDALIATVQASCPGCATGGSYAYVYVTQAPNGEYLLRHDIGPYGIGEAQATLEGCTPEPPTAVTLASFEAAASRCHVAGSSKRPICMCPNGESRFKSAPMWRCR